MLQISVVPSRSPLTVCVPLDANEARTTGELCLRNTPTSLPSDNFQRRPVASAADDSAHLPFAESATDRTAASWPVSICRHLPETTSQMRMVLSSLPEMKRSPPSANATDVTAAVCPSNACDCLPDSRSHKRSTRSA